MFLVWWQRNEHLAMLLGCKAWSRVKGMHLEAKAGATSWRDSHALVKSPILFCGQEGHQEAEIKVLIGQSCISQSELS